MRRLVKVVAAIPRGHLHMRMALIFDDGEVVILSEALAAGLARAYIDVAAHPTRRGVVLCVGEVEGKPGYAKTQLIECGGEGEALAEIEELLRGEALGEKEGDRGGSGGRRG
ncbi:MAG: hypothetical protein TU35_009440 [Thermoproteus sp. AZ2]|jgi:hypothetical protein|uniref:Uncharacterized protein n=1 Tax=Thermoproteus sp. AZ2 TaxID=1609232 RepID=A0ACC6V3V7_9CREN|nr:MAG: hypothetical protein TU35_06130 [Thermoproteus sp. AZ2]